MRGWGDGGMGGGVSVVFYVWWWLLGWLCFEEGRKREEGRGEEGDVGA